MLDERILAAMTSFNRCRRRFVASSRCVGMDRRYDSVPLMGRKVTLRATEATGIQVEELRANAPRPRCFPRVVWTLVMCLKHIEGNLPGG